MNKNKIISNALEYNNVVSETLDELSSPLKDNFGITTIAYARFNDNKIFHISNNVDWYDFYITNGFFDSPHHQTEINNLVSDKYVVLRKGNNKFVQAMHRFNVWHGISIYKRSNDLIEMWNFATYKNNENILNFYLNNLSLLEKFIIYVKNKAGDIFNPSNNGIWLNRKKSIILPQAFDNSKAHQFLSETSLDKFKLENSSATLTKKEMDYLYYLSLGKSIKEISYIMNISPRTLETRLNYMKNKLNCSYKSDLIQVFHESSLKDLYK
ncbi:MAG: hypothetical protein J0H68_08180 [Sphingobacteriia bacterium]|nr:hypothetical protein [Sphingobacteriia bacterium]